MRLCSSYQTDQKIIRKRERRGLGGGCREEMGGVSAWVDVGTPLGDDVVALDCGEGTGGSAAKSSGACTCWIRRTNCWIKMSLVNRARD
jgi:hypothetical protein